MEVFIETSMVKLDSFALMRVILTTENPTLLDLSFSVFKNKRKQSTSRTSQTFSSLKEFPHKLQQ